MNNKKCLDNGFLDDDLIIEVKRIRIENNKLYQIIKKLNLLFYEIEKNYEKDNGTEVELYLFTTFSQIHISFQSYIILLERGLYDESQIILRSMYDKMFKCLYVLNTDNSLKQVEQDNIKEQLSLYKYILDNKLFDYVPEEKLKSYIKELEKIRILKDNKKHIEMPDNKTISRKLDMKEAYVHYKILCNYTHNSAYVINSRIFETENGYIIDQNIKHGDFKDEIIKMILCVGYVINPICNYIGLNEIKNEINKNIETMLKI